ncbi:MAG TPA: hypothetical protein P5542_06165 [Candidatus Syntrophosphaera sp.]|jgi:hypothetical protein|nr:hypothetical protein [Candidatus Syntrophosphaera thermopropionivorans]HRC99930.1 hypothetical protein [Candidatus Syntrophosphaera thermopropionivorans]HRR98260.1 hypothetical protein [Candidatus Syntrophosphaera sp.]
MRKLLTIILLSITILFSFTCLEAAVKVKVKASVETKKNKPKPEEIKTAINNAKILAIKKYGSEKDTRKRELINELLPEIEKNIDNYILEVNYLNDGSKINGVWEQLLEVTIDDVQLELLINEKMKDVMETKEPTYISFIYVAREVSSVETQDKTVKQDISSKSDISTSGKVSSSEKIKGEVSKTGKLNLTTQDEINISQSDSRESSRVYSQSVINKSEGIAYRAYNPAEIDAKVTEIFNKANFEVVPAYEVGILPEKFAYDFAYLNEISSSTQKEATDIASEAGLDFLAVAMLDVGREEIDPVTGGKKVYVKVNGYILDLRKKFAVKVCSAGPYQFSGLGSNPSVAKTNALIEAATHASQDLVDQLRVKLGM